MSVFSHKASGTGVGPSAPGWQAKLPRWQCVAATMLLLALPAAAAPRALAIATGDCKDPELLSAMSSFAKAFEAELGGDALTGAAVLEQLKASPRASLTEIAQSIEAAQSAFYAGKHEQALEGSRDAQASLQRLPPSAAAWPAMAKARVLEGLVLKAHGRKAEAVEAFRRVLRIEPSHALDPDYYSPATIAQFEQVRKEVQRLKKVELTVAAPAGLKVLLDGFVAGTTPYVRQLLPGTYRVQLANEEAASFVYEVNLLKAHELRVDFMLESALRPSLPLCVAADGRGTPRAVALAARAQATQVVALKLVSRSGEPGWLSAELANVSSGAQLREGGMKLAEAQRGDGFRQLVRFVLTGNASTGVVASTQAQGALAADRFTPSAGLSAQSTGRRLGPRIASIAAMGAGVVTAAVALGWYVGGASERAAMSMLLDGHGNLPSTQSPDYQRALELDRNINARATLSAVLAGVGGALVAAGVALFFALPPQEHAEPSVAAFVVPAAGAFSAGLTGRW